MTHPKNSLEILESRIAPATAIATADFVPAIVGGPTLLHAGQGLGTANENSGTYLLYVEKGDALVFTTDFNNNGTVDFNEITGIAAGDGLRLISFVNIYGDIVTNLDPNLTLSDSDNNTANDDPFLKGDGRVVNNATIEKIELRSLTPDDLLDQNADGTVDDEDVSLRLALSSYSIFGTIYAGKGFGVSGDPTSGLLIDDLGRAQQQVDFGTGLGLDFFYNFKPQIGSIRSGTATNGEYFSFGISQNNDTQGLLTTFVPPVGQNGGDIVNVRAATPFVTFNIDALIAGNGGNTGRGGNIEGIILNSDTAGGYIIRAGDGGRGPSGSDGGSIINFQDLGSVTSEVVIRSGDGGAASTGDGGNGGNISFGTMTINAGLQIVLGSGGNGFTGGGNGATLTKAKVTTPEGAVEFPNRIIGTIHLPGAVGRHTSLDFDQDGFGDMAYTSSDPDQLVVDFGDGLGGFRSDLDPLLPPGTITRIYLAGVNNGDALTAGDFDGDGFTDLATGSHEDGNFDGIVVFLAKTEDLDRDGILSDAEDVNSNDTTDFLGFQAPLRSPLPSLHRGDPDFIELTLSYFYRRSATPISDIQAGDFDGDGVVDLAVTATYTSQAPNQRLHQVVFFMSPDIEVSPEFPLGRPTGQFFANVGTRALADPPTPANPLVPFTFLNGANEGDATDAVIEFSALAEGGALDVLVGRSRGVGGSILVLDNSIPSIFGPLIFETPLPRVDTARGLGVNLVRPTMRDFTISDTDGNGTADFVAITETPAGFIVGLEGDGLALTTPLIGEGGDDTGWFAPDFNLGTGLTNIRTTDQDADGIFDDIAAIFSDTGPLGTRSWEVADDPAGNNGNDQLAPGAGTPENIRGLAMDIHFSNTNDTPTLVSYLAGEPIDVAPPHFILELVGGLPVGLSPFFFVSIAEHGIAIDAGDGGDALVGNGGLGGIIGDALEETTVVDPVTGVVTTDLVGTIDITLPQNIFYQGLIDFTGGDGGNGFSFGGKAGGVTGTTVRYVTDASARHSSVSLFGGNGGFGVAGPGGGGGDLIANSIQSGEFFTAGNGGRGAIGGPGGSIRGNGRVGFFDSEDLTVVLQAGNGGNGVKTGGAGGDISDFVTAFSLFFIGDVGGILRYAAGNGGNAISGEGGRGGDVAACNPLEGANNLAGNITLIGGNGGNGKSGGFGGSVRDFTDKPSESDNPAVLTFIAGTGGNGTKGRGGDGGGLINIDSPSVGKPNVVAFDPFQLYTFNRFLAGDGGKSSGGKGGHGGPIMNIITSNSDNPVVMVSGAGGSGLYKGGNGGQLSDVTMNIGTESFNKALIIAGAGGSAAAFIPNDIDTTPGQNQKAFGGKVGKAGNGGSIVNFTQEGSIGARIDLIAGNGGDTINYGTVVDKKIFVGKGGSLMNINLTGNVGNITPNIRLQSYNDVFAGESVQDFVTTNLRAIPVLPVLPDIIDDSQGMVGAVVGAAGRLKVKPTVGGFRSQPALNGTDGSILGLTARNIASAVAGAVERIAAIQSVSGIQITGGGELGKNFDDTIDPAPYRDPLGNPIPEPVLDGRLVDGALVYSKFKPNFNGVSISLPIGRVFQLG